MYYLYHRVPNNMKGGILYPLNQLKDIDLTLYEEERSKYENRMHVMEQPVPPLNCLWNDVIHLAALHPQKVQDELEKHNDSLINKKFFQIDPHILEPEKTTVFLFGHNIEEEKYQSDNWATYDPDNIGKYSEFPERTSRYYARSFEKGENPLLWAFVPHIMYKGHIDTTDIEIIELK